MDTSPKAIYNTMFGIHMSLYYSAGAAAGSFVGGIVYNRLGGAIMYQGTCVLGSVWIVTMVTFFHFVRQSSVNRVSINSDDDRVIEDEDTVNDVFLGAGGDGINRVGNEVIGYCDYKR